ncbi:YebC/PmpR family DNA-binding transcriptional regulator, partial [Candidatus Acetothermia bacterium]
LPVGLDRDELLMSLIEAGAQEMDDQGETIEITCSPADLTSVAEAVRKMGLTPIRSELTMVPKNTVRVEGQAAAKVLKLIEALDENEDVQEVFANFDIPDEVLEKIDV